MNNVYRNAVEHLQFTDSLRGNVYQLAGKKHHFRKVRNFAVAAILIVLSVTSVFALEQQMRIRKLQLNELGSVEADMSGAEVMVFQKIESTEDVIIHYLEMDIPGGYNFMDGIIYHENKGFYRIGSDYQLVSVEGSSISGELQKNGKTYTLDFDYVFTDTGIVAPNAAVYTMDDGRILGMVWSEDHHCWPVILDLETNTVTDALQGFRSDDFVGRICYAQPFRDGLLLTTLKSSDVFVDGVLNSYNLLYYIKDGSRKAIEISLPKWNNMTHYCENDTIYCKPGSGPLYELDDNYEFSQIDEFRTTDDLTKGLLTGRGTDGKLAVNDHIYNQQYLIEEIVPDRWDFYETTGHNATRHSYDGKILITYSYDDYDARTRRISKIGLLDPTSGTLKMMETHSNFALHTFGWLDDDRFAVIYEKGARKFMCIYEFLD